MLTGLKVVVALGKIAFDVYLDVLKSRGAIPSRAPFVFGHDLEYRMPELPVLISSYHPSQQNTSTGKLTEAMLTRMFPPRPEGRRDWQAAGNRKVVSFDRNCNTSIRYK